MLYWLLKQITIPVTVGCWIVLATAIFIAISPREFNDWSWTAIVLLCFNNLNLWISYCEIILGIYIDEIQQEYRNLFKEYEDKLHVGCLRFLQMPLFFGHYNKEPSLYQGLIASWIQMWSTYSLYDPSYQNRESFGFFIDYGNGLTTIPFCLLCNFAIAFGNSSESWLLSPLFVGCLGLASYWQILYGTIIYWLSFGYNRRYRGKNWVHVFAFVGCTNGLWFVFPIMALYVCVSLVRDRNYDVFSTTTSTTFIEAR